MIRFTIGFFGLILTAGGVEGTASFSLIISTFAVGIIFSLWGLSAMAKNENTIL